MASSGYLEKETSEAFIEFLVQQCAISEAESKQVQGHHSATKDVKATEVADLAIDKVFSNKPLNCFEILQLIIGCLGNVIRPCIVYWSLFLDILFSVL